MKTILFLITAFCAVLIIVVLFFILQRMQGSQNLGTPQVSAPTLAPTQTETRLPNRVTYDLQKGREVADKAKSRQPLSQAGISAKNTLISTLPSGTGIVYAGTAVKISYLSAPDLFQGEILTLPAADAKSEAVNWMISHGFTRDDICNLPLSFYLGASAYQKAAESNLKFNPAPDGC